MPNLNIKVEVKRVLPISEDSIKYDLFINGCRVDWFTLNAETMEAYTEAHWIIKKILGIDDELEIIDKYLVEDSHAYQVASPNCHIKNDILVVSEDGKTWGFSDDVVLFEENNYHFTESEYKNLCDRLGIPFDLFKKVEGEE